MTPRGSAWTAHGQRWAPCTGHRSRSRRTTHTSSIRARTRIRTRTHRTASAPRSISICEKSFQTEMISPPFHPRLFWSLVFSVRINQFRGIFTAKMRLVRLFPDACNGDVTHYTTFWSVRGAILARSAAETRFARLRSGHKISITLLLLVSFNPRDRRIYYCCCCWYRGRNNSDEASSTTDDDGIICADE